MINNILNRKLKNIKGAIFDLDGTVLDSMWVWDKVDINFLGDRGFEVPVDYVETIAPLGAERAAAYTIERFGLNETVESVVNQWFEMAVMEYATQVQCKPYAYEYIKLLKDNGVKMAVATSSDRELFGTTLERTGLDKLFDAEVMVKEVKRGKGFPDIYEEAAKRINVNPQGCVVFEDILPGIKGAQKGGFSTVGVYEQRSQRDVEMIRQTADLFIQSFEELM